MAGFVIHATGTADFEEGLRIGNLSEAWKYLSEGQHILEINATIDSTMAVQTRLNWRQTKVQPPKFQ